MLVAAKKLVAFRDFPPIESITKQSLVLSSTPPALDHAIRRCLAKDPEERWQTARDLELELKSVAEKGSQPGAPASFVGVRSFVGGSVGAARLLQL